MKDEVKTCSDDVTPTPPEPPIDPVEAECAAIYDETMNESDNVGTQGLDFDDFYGITCFKFWPYCSKAQAQQAFTAADINPKDDWLSSEEFLIICKQFIDDPPTPDDVDDLEELFDDCD